MSELSKEMLQAVISSILEESAFVFLSVADPPPPFEEEILEASLPFSGPGAGTLVITATTSFAANLAANLLGTDESDPSNAEHASDAFGEIVNIIGGEFVNALFGDDVSCHLGVPDVKKVSAKKHDKNQAAASCAIALISDEEQRIDGAVKLEKS